MKLDIALKTFWSALWTVAVLGWMWLGLQFIEVGNQTEGHLSVGFVAGVIWAYVLRALCAKVVEAFYAWRRNA